MVLSLLTATAQASLSILFIGNSHTAVNDVPNLVRNLLVNDGSDRRVTTKAITGGLLNDQAKSPDILKEIKSGKYNVIVLQGAAVSSSHKYTYTQEGGIALAKAAQAAKARTFLFAEWPREGWDEAQYIMQVYEQIARPSGASIVPIPWVFRKALQAEPKFNGWQPDGNHATMTGSYLAAATLYFWISNQHIRVPDWQPPHMDHNDARWLIKFAQNQHKLENPD